MKQVFEMDTLFIEGTKWFISTSEIMNRSWHFKDFSFSFFLFCNFFLIIIKFVEASPILKLRFALMYQPR